MNERRDGTQPRSNPAQSKTIWAQIAQWAGAVVPGAAAWLQAESDVVKAVVLGGVAVVLVAGVVVFRERLRKWADGDR